jgi:predicted RNase H-like nuclease (RuvC/YqgF family)
MPDKNFPHLLDTYAFTTHSDTVKETKEKLQKVNFERAKMEVDKEYIERRIDKLCDGRSTVQGCLERARDREEESKLRGQEAQRKKSAKLADSYEREIDKHDEYIDTLEETLEDLDRKQKKWDREQKKLRDIEKMCKNSVAKLQKK